MKKTLRTLLLAALMVLTLCATAAAADQNGYNLTFGLNEDGYLAASLFVPGTPCGDGYCVSIYNAADPDIYYDFYYDASVEWPCELMTTEEAIYDTVRVAQGADTWFKDASAVTLAQWTLPVPVKVKTDAFSLPSTITLEKSEEFDDFIWYNILGANSYYSYMLEEIGNWGGGILPGEDPNAEEYTLCFTADSGATSFLLYGFDFIVNEDDCIMYVSKAMTLTANSGDAEANYAVSNIRFEMFAGTPNLVWNVPSSAVSDMEYLISASTDGGITWENYIGTSQNRMALMMFEGGTYNAVKVETLVNDEVVAECVATDLTYTATQGADLPCASVTASVSANGRYDFIVSGLTPDVHCMFELQGGGLSAGMVGADGIFTHDDIDSAEVEALLAEDASYLVKEFTNGAVSADGKSASMTISDRGSWTKLSTLFGGEDTEPGDQSGYGVGLEVWNNIFFVNPIVPEGTDEEQMYDIYLYSSETGNSFGNMQFSLGGGVVVPDVAGTYDRAKLLKSGTQKVLADVELEKPVIASFTLEVPAGVTVSRTEINATTDQYTVKGIDLNKYGYELSPDGYGGKNLSEETFTIGKDYYGDMTTAYVQIFSAVEKEDAYYLDRSPYATVTVNEGESGGEDTEPGDQNSYGMKVYLEPPALIATMTGPANATTDPVFDYEFYSSTDDSVFAGLGSMPLNAAQAFAFSAGTYDSYRVCHENGEVMGEGKLSKPIISTHDAFTISGVTLSAEGVQDDGRTRFHLQGLDLENYTYTLETESSGFYIYSEWLTAAADRLANGAVLYAYRNSEDDTAFYQQRSVGLELTVGGESGGSGGNEDGGDTGTDAAYAVSNIHFEMLSGLPYLYWDAPASSSEEMRYEVFFSTDGGKNWELLSSTSQTFISLGNVAAGSYNAVKVTTEVDNETVAECVAADVALTITQGAQLAPAKVVFKKLDDGRYEATVSGLTPNVYYHFMMKAGGSASSSGSTTGDNGTFTKTYDAQKIEKYLSKDGAYLVQEHTDGAVSADGKSASMTVSNRGDWVKLADALKGGSAETPTVSGTVTNGGGASIEINGQSVQVNEDGSFEIPAEGTFDVAIKKGGCLTYTIKGVSAENGNVELPEVVLVAGDVNEDGKINIQDMGTFRAEFGKTGDAIGNDYTDVNEDGKVNIQDMGTFRANFGKTAEKDCTVEYGA